MRCSTPLLRCGGSLSVLVSLIPYVERTSAEATSYPSQQLASSIVAQSSQEYPLLAVMGTQTITESGVAQTVSGQLISLGETKIILGTRTIGMPHIQAGTQHLPLPYAGTSEFDVAFLAGPVTRSAVERAGSTQTGAISAEPTFEIAFTLGYRTYTAFRVGSNGKAVVGNRTMTAGGSALTLEGGSVSMAMNNDLVFGDAVTTSTPRARPSSSADPAQASTAKGGNSTTSQDLEMPRPVITLGTHTYTAVQPSGTKYAVLDGKTLSIGQAISVPGGTVSFDTDNDLIMFVDPVTHPASNVTASTAATTSATAATTSIGQAVPSGPVPGATTARTTASRAASCVALDVQTMLLSALVLLLATMI